MKLGVMADSHENMPRIRSAVGLFRSRKVDLVCHAGDIISPITFQEFKDLRIPMKAVFGNNDGERDFLREKFAGAAEFFAEPYVFEAGGRRIALMHKPIFVDQLLQARSFDVILYGHTHVIDVRRNGGTLVLNPGETGGWLSGRCTAAILDLDTLEPEIVDL